MRRIVLLAALLAGFAATATSTPAATGTCSTSYNRYGAGGYDYVGVAWQPGIIRGNNSIPVQLIANPNVVSPISASTDHSVISASLGNGANAQFIEVGYGFGNGLGFPNDGHWHIFYYARDLGGRDFWGEVNLPGYSHSFQWRFTGYTGQGLPDYGLYVDGSFLPGVYITLENASSYWLQMFGEDYNTDASPACENFDGYNGSANGANKWVQYAVTPGTPFGWCYHINGDEPQVWNAYFSPSWSCAGGLAPMQASQQSGHPPFLPPAH